jgi:hypothetical protein
MLRNILSCFFFNKESHYAELVHKFCFTLHISVLNFICLASLVIIIRLKAKKISAESPCFFFHSSSPSFSSTFMWVILTSKPHHLFCLPQPAQLFYSFCINTFPSMLFPPSSQFSSSMFSFYFHIQTLLTESLFILKHANATLFHYLLTYPPKLSVKLSKLPVCLYDHICHST